MPLGVAILLLFYTFLCGANSPSFTISNNTKFDNDISSRVLKSTIVTLHEFSEITIGNLLDHFDGDTSIELLKIHIPNELIREAHIYGTVIDTGLAPRPWWQIRDEEITLPGWRYNRLSQKKSLRHFQSRLRGDGNSILWLERESRDVESFFRFISKISFRSNEDCLQSPMIVKTTT